MPGCEVGTQPQFMRRSLLRKNKCALTLRTQPAIPDVIRGSKSSDQSHHRSSRTSKTSAQHDENARRLQNSVHSSQPSADFQAFQRTINIVQSNRANAHAPSTLIRQIECLNGTTAKPAFSSRWVRIASLLSKPLPTNPFKIKQIAPCGEMASTGAHWISWS